MDSEEIWQLMEYFEFEYCVDSGLTDEEIEEGWDLCYQGMLIRVQDND